MTATVSPPCPEFERMLIRSGIQGIEYWFSVSDTEQVLDRVLGESALSPRLCW